MSEVDFPQAIAFLQKTSSTGGDSLYEHLTKVILRVLEDKPKDAVDLLETTLLVKKTEGDIGKARSFVKSASEAAKAVATLSLFGQPDLPIDPDTGEPVEADPPNEYESEDVVGDGELFSALGVGVGAQEMYEIMLMVKKLGEDPKRGIKTIRFFGKFFGICRDYYVFETILQDMPEEPDQQPGEGEAPVEWNTGVNGYVYLVCNYLGGPCVQLPHVTPQQIKVARQLKRFLTGRLTAQVSAYPIFPGTEAAYLRAQIARIAATTVCCPVGYFTVNEDEGGIEKSEEYDPPPMRELGSPASWCHRYPHLKKQGRCEVFKREVPEDEDEDTFPFTEEELEEGPEPLATLDQDSEVQGDAAWTPLFSSTAEHVKNQVAGVRSNLWPGAVCACKGTHFASIYVGWGIKNAPFVPLPPPPVSKEYDQSLVESSELPPKPEPAKSDDDDEGEE